MTRRVLVGLLGIGLAPEQTPVEQEREFFELYNEFVACMGEAMAAQVRRAPNVKLDEKAEEAFKRLVNHPLWLRKR